MSAVVALLTVLAVLVWPGRRPGRAARAGLRRHVGADGPVPAHQRVVAAVGRVLGRRSRAPGGSGRGTAAAGRSGDGSAGQWLPVLDQLCAALRSGLPPAEAVAMARTGAGLPVREALAVVLEAARDGRPCAPAWARVVRSSSAPELALVARSWAVSERLGAPLADAVESASRALRSRRDLDSKLETATAGARTTAAILTLLPVAGVGLALLMGIGPATLYGSWPALCSLAGGLLLLAVGRVVVTGMISRATALS